MTTYKIIRFYADPDIKAKVVKRNMTLLEAQRHCHDPETSSRTATGIVERERTAKFGPWFEGYEEDES